jgi:20S proteasome alpha/beta subunit
MGNGCVLEGFVESVSGDYLNLVETNNQKVIVNTKHISFARLGGSPDTCRVLEETYREETQAEETDTEKRMPLPYVVSTHEKQPRSEEYSVLMSNVGDNPYVKPKFVRSSDR